MTKIPQGEWSAIAERYSRGESISSIARHYGCTAPAIHYILKRNKERAVVSNPRPALAQSLTKPEVSLPARSGGGENGRSSSSLTGRKAPTGQAVLPPPKEHHQQMEGTRLCSAYGTDTDRGQADSGTPATTRQAPTREPSIRPHGRGAACRCGSCNPGVSLEL
jgi:hypothetical protein